MVRLMRQWIMWWASILPIWMRWWSIPDAAERRAMRNTALIVVPCGLVAVAAIGMLVASFTQPLRIEPPLAYSAQVYQPEVGAVCPGDTVRWRVNLTVRRAPVMVVQVRTIWDVDDHETATVNGATVSTPLQFAVWTTSTVIDRDASIAIPRGLRTGHYEVRNAAQEFNSAAAAYVVPFRVKWGCPTP